MPPKEPTKTTSSIVRSDEEFQRSFLRQEESGLLQTLSSIEVYLQFENFPIWLLALDQAFVSRVWILGFATATLFFDAMKSQGGDVQLLSQALKNVSPSEVKHATHATLPPGAVLLISGSLSFVSQWNDRTTNPTMVLCDEHVRNRTSVATASAKELRWMLLRHTTFGGVTHFQALLGTNIPQFTPTRTALRRCLQHILDFGVKPKWAQPPTTDSARHLSLLLSDRLHPDQLQTPVLYHSHYSATGWGTRTLTVDEIGIAFGLPAWARHANLQLAESFPLVPIQIMDGCLKGILLSIPRVSPLHTPDPLPAHSQSNQSWLPSINRFLSHSWIDAGLVTDKAVKRDDAGVPTQLWDQRCSLVLPHVTPPVLNTLRRLLLQRTCRSMVNEFRAYLVSTYGPDWLTILDAAKVKAAAKARTALRDAGAVGGNLHQGRSSHTRKRTRGDTRGDTESENAAEDTSISDAIQEELVKDVKAGTDAISRFADSDWWTWHRGSALFFWRWPPGEQRTFARDGMPAWVLHRLPKYQRKPRPPDPKTKPLILKKLQAILDRGYVTAPTSRSFIKSLMDFFEVEKGSDIRLVYNGTSCGLNDAIWAPNFWLPTPATAARSLGYGYFMVDIDLGEMFLNFPLPILLQRFSGVDFRHYVSALTNPDLERHLDPALKPWVHWTRCWMGLKPSPFMAVRFYYLAEEFARGNRKTKNNPLRWDIVRLNLPGDPAYDPTLPRVMKWDTLVKKIAGDIAAFVDDLRTSGHSVEQAWAIARQVVSRIQYLGLQDAPRKRRPPVRNPGAWAGAIFKTTNNEVLQSVSQEKWDKAKFQVRQVRDFFQLPPEELMNYKKLEIIRGFLCHISMTYSIVTPYLKGFHLTLAAHHPGRGESGWKMPPNEWSAYLYEAVESGKFTKDEADLLRDSASQDEAPEPTGNKKSYVLPDPPKCVRPVPRLEQDAQALVRLFDQAKPAQTLIRAARVYTILYGFADASGSGFGSTVLGSDGIRYRIGTWGSDMEDSSSNFKEFENVVAALKAEAAKGHLLNALIFLCTDNSTVESAIVKGNSSSPKLFELTLEVRVLEMENNARVVVSHVAGERMRDQGTDGVSRGQLKEGVSVGQDMLSFIPFHLSAVQRQPSVETWIQSWLGVESELLTPEGWFERGHDILGGNHDSKGFWRHEYKTGSFIWAPPPGAAAVAIEELRKARIKRQHSFHVFVCPRLLKPEWFRQLYKAADLVFDVPAGTEFWPVSMHEPLIFGVVFPFLSKPPWQLRRTPKMFSVERKLRQLWKESALAPGNLLRQLFLEYQRLRTMPADVVRRVLYFESRCPVPREAASHRRGRKRKRSSTKTATDLGVGNEASPSR